MADVNEIRIQYVLDTSDLKTAKQQFDGLTQAEKKAEDEAEKLREELKKTGKEGADSAKKAKEGFGDLNDLLKKGGGLIAGYFAADQLISFGKQVVEITGKFQRYAAVLKNSLGTGSAAEAAMSMIKKFAAETPFSVDELTDSFVRLSNGGFKPTQNQMRQLGDLASSTGKSFNQLSEAILDAQTGEFERLKEFGIIARKSGENVTFTFKGVETQTKMTSKAIQEYVLSLGDAVGVSGAMTAISKTLEGQTSNLGDTWDALLLIIGDGVAPLYSKVLGVTSEFLADLQLLFRSSQDDQRENNSDMYQGMVDDAMKYDKELLEESMRANALYLEEYKKQQDALIKEKTKLEEEDNALTQATKKVFGTLFGDEETRKEVNRTSKTIRDELREVQKALAVYQAKADAYAEIVKVQASATKKDSEKSAAELAAATKKNKERYALELKALETSAQIAKIDIKLTTKSAEEKAYETLIIEEKFLNDKIALNNKYAKEGLKELKKDNKLLAKEAQLSAQAQLEALEKMIENDPDAYNYDKAKKEREKEKQDDIKTKDEMYNTEKKAIQDRLKLNNLDVDATKKTAEEKARLKIENELAANKETLDINEMYAEWGSESALKEQKDLNTQILAANKGLNNQLLDQDKELAKKKKAIQEESAKIYADTAMEVLTNLNSLYMSNIDDEMRINNKKFDEEIRLADGSEQKINEINARRAEMEKEANRKKFQAQQMQALAEVTFAAAPYIIKYTAGLPLTAPLLTATSFALAAQIALIASQKMPEYALGTRGKRHKGGPAIVGELGTERIVTESGKVYYTPPTATLMDLPAGAQVIPNNQLPRQEIFYASRFSQASSSNESYLSKSIESKLGEIGGILKSLPIHQISMDERGFNKFITTPNRTTKILNNRFPK